MFKPVDFPIDLCCHHSIPHFSHGSPASEPASGPGPGTTVSMVSAGLLDGGETVVDLAVAALKSCLQPLILGPFATSCIV